MTNKNRVTEQSLAVEIRIVREVKINDPAKKTAHPAKVTESLQTSQILYTESQYCLKSLLQNHFFAAK